MKKCKVRISYKNGRFDDVIIEANSSDAAERMAKAQYSGPNVKDVRVIQVS